jgi:anti-anti-sigma regulatory factor
MPYTIQTKDHKLALELTGGVTARDVGEICAHLAPSLKGELTVVLHTRELEDIDTSVLQMLVSLRKTVTALLFENPSDAFVNAVERCALRRELLADSKEAA